MPDPTPAEAQMPRPQASPHAKGNHLAAEPVLTLEQQRAALREGKIIGCRCGACGHETLAPMLRCPACRSPRIARREFSPSGTVATFTIQSVAAEAFLNETPFAFVVVKLDDGPRVSGWIPWIARPPDLPLGQKVEYTPSYKPGMMFEKR